MRKNISNVKNLTYASVKLDVIRVLRPVTKMMQDLTLLTYEFITVCEAAKENITCMSILFGDSVENGMEATIFCDDVAKEIFPPPTSC